jgi:hypothetical protein
VAGQCAGWDESLVSCCRPTNSACLVTPWSAWSACTQLCLGGTQTRTRDIVAPASGTFAACPSTSDPERLQSQRCDVCDICIMSAYSNWSACSKSCGGGERSRTRSVTQPATCDCTPCSSTLRDTQSCNSQACECGLTVCPTPAPPIPTSVGTIRADGSILVDFCDPATVAITVASDATANLVGGVNVDFAPQDSGDALERKSCSLQTRNGAGGALTLVFSKPMVLISLKLFAFDAGDVGELLFDDALKRSPRVVPLKGRDNALEMSTFRGHQSYAIVMFGTTQFGIEALVVREPNGVTFLAPTPATAAPGGLDEVGSGTAVGINTGEVPAMSGGGEDDLLPLWIVLGVLACIVVTLLVAFFCWLVSSNARRAGVAEDVGRQVESHYAQTGADFRPSDSEHYTSIDTSIVSPSAAHYAKTAAEFRPNDNAAHYDLVSDIRIKE